MEALLTPRRLSSPTSVRRMETVLNQWFHFGPVDLTTRLPGLSIVSRTNFGIFQSDEWHGEDHWLCDELSGLSLRTGAAERCELLRDNRAGALRFELALQSQVELSVASRQPNEPIADMFHARPESPRSQPWLDEWTECDRHCAGCSIGCQNKVDCIKTWREIEVSIVSSDLTLRIKFRPTWIDRDATVLRLSDAGQRHVIHLDLATPALSLQSLSERAGILNFHHLPS